MVRRHNLVAHPVQLVGIAGDEQHVRALMDERRLAMALPAPGAAPVNTPGKCGAHYSLSGELIVVGFAAGPEALTEKDARLTAGDIS
jgi:hypothetical protein